MQTAWEDKDQASLEAEVLSHPLRWLLWFPTAEQRGGCFTGEGCSPQRSQEHIPGHGIQRGIFVIY